MEALLGRCDSKASAAPLQGKRTLQRLVRAGFSCQCEMRDSICWRAVGKGIRARRQELD